jgi:hypothetical protein
MKKLAIPILALILGLTSAALVHAEYPNEPASFRGVAWGANLKDLKGFKVVQESGDFIVAQKTDDDLKFGQAVLDSVQYLFYRNRMYRVNLKYSELWNYDRLKERLFRVFGKGKEKTDDHRRFDWTGRDVDVILTWEVFARGGTVSFVYRAVDQEWKEVEGVLAKEGSPDF